MIQRIMLPNLAIKTNKKTTLSNHKQPTRIYDTITSSIHEQPQTKFLKAQSDHKYNFSSLNNIEVKEKLNHLKTQQSLHSQMNTLEMKKINPHVFHTKVDKQRQLYKESYRDMTQGNEKKNIAPYFFKIHCSLKILQNQDQLNRKMLQTQKQQTNKLKSQTVNNSKKRIQKKLTNSSSKKLQASIDHSQNTARFSTKTTSKHANSKKKFHTEPSQLQNSQSLLQDRKRQLALKGKQGKYTFEHFNSGQIFQSIAELNEKRILTNSDQNQYRVTSYGTYVNNVSGSKHLNKKTVQNHLQEEFKQQYNSFLKNKLPPSFGQNGNKSCIYEEYVEKRKAEQLNNIKSKVATRSQPKKSLKAQSIFSNQINNICERKAEAQRMYNSTVRNQEEEVIKRTRVGFLKHSSTKTSRMVSEMNSKLNTLRHGQTLQDKLKLKKLAKLEFMQKAKLMKKKNMLKSIKEGRDASSLSEYSSNKDVNVTDEQMIKLMQKSQLILGKQFVLSNPVLNPQQQIEKSTNILKKGVYKFPELNQYQAKHLQHIDSLLKKQISTLRKEKQGLDSTPWRIPIKIGKKPYLH